MSINTIDSPVRRKVTEVYELIEKVSNRIKNTRNTSINEVCKISIIDIDNWEWAQGVCIFGLYTYAKQTKNDRELAWIKSWIDKNIKKGLPERNINTTAPLLTTAFIGEDTNNAEYLSLCREWAEWIVTDLPKTKFGGYQHVVSDGPNTEQLWDDTLFMTVLFMAKMGVMDQRKEYLKACEYQFLLHTHYLQDRKSGLWYHGWTFDGNHNFANALWGRGNGWITAFIPNYLEMTGGDCAIKEYMLSVLNAQAEALAACQDESGLWHTLLDDETSYLEVSASAGVAYGILKAVRMGILDIKYKNMAMKAVRAVIENIDDDGTVLNVSYGTGMGKTLQDYRDIPICPMTYGQSLAIMMLAEVLKHI